MTITPSQPLLGKTVFEIRIFWIPKPLDEEGGK